MILELCVVLVTIILLGYSFQRRPKGFPPGPTGVPFLGYAPFLGLKPHVTLAELTKKFGKIYSIFLGNNRIVLLNDIKDIRAACKTNVFAGRPKDKLLAMEVLPDGIVYNEGPAWEEQRRFSVNCEVFRDFGFGKHGMSESIQEEVQDLVNYFRQQGNNSFNPRAAIQQATVNANILRTLANERYPIGDARAAQIQKTAHEGFIEPATDSAVYFFPSLAKMLPKLSGFSRMMKAVNDFSQMWSKTIEEHQKTISEDFSRDYIDMALKKIQATDDPKSSFYKDNGLKQLNELLTAFFVGGTDTVSTSLCYLLMFMVNYPMVMKKAQQEIDRVVGRSRLPSLDDRANMPYMEALMSEILRITSIVPWAIFHSTMDDTELGGFKIPKRTIIIPNLWFVHHDDTLWEAPNQFRPERFLNSDGTFQKSMTENLIPFGVGKRVCPAETVGMNSFFMFASGLLQNFDFEAHPDHLLPRTDDPALGMLLFPKPFQICALERK